MKITELKKILETFDKKELVNIVNELAKLRKDNMDWLTTRFQDSKCNQKTIEIYKKKIHSGFYTPRGFPRGKFAEAKRAISDFKQASKDKEAIIGLMIFYVETGTDYLTYDDRNEQVYTSMENTFENIIKYLLDLNDITIIGNYKPRLEVIIANANCLGYGYQDSLKAMYEELKPADDNKKGDAAI